MSGTVSGATAQGVPQISVNQTINNLTPNVATVTYPVTCSDVSVGTFTLTVTVNPKPELSNLVSPTAICSGTTFSYTAASATSGTTFTWNRAAVSNITPTNGSGSSGTIAEVLTNGAGSSRTVSYIINLSANGCTNSQNLDVTVNPLPVLSSTLTPADICGGSPFSYNPTSAQVPPGTFAWTRAAISGNAGNSGTGNPNETLINNTTGTLTANYTYTLTATASGCTNQQTVTVNVKPLPQLTSSTTFTHCSGSAFTYTPTSSIAGTVFNWNRATVPNINPGGTFGNGSINEVLTNTSAGAATATYVYALSVGGCTTNNQNVSVTVNPLPTLSSTLTAGNTCSGTMFNYSASSSQSPVTLNWTRAIVPGIANAAGSGAGNIGEVLTNSTTTTIPVLYQYAITNTTTTCTNSQVVTVNVNPIPTVVDYPITICNHQGFISIPNAPIGTTYTWATPTVTPGGAITNTLSAQSVDQPVVSEAILHNGTASDALVEYDVTPTLGACTGPNFKLSVTVHSGAVPTIDLASSLTPPGICSGTTFSYLPLSNSSSPTFSYERLAVAGISNPASSGTGTITETLVNTTNLPVTTYYYVTVSSGGCSNSFTVNAVVNPGTQLSSSLTPADVCSGTAFTYTPTSATPSTSQYNWQRPVVAGISNAIASGSGNINETLVNTTTAPISVNYNFVLLTSATPACTFSQTVTVVVNPAPALSSASTIPAVCSGSTVNYTASSATSGTLFSWTRAVAANINEPSSAGFNPINEVLTNTSLTPATANYVITLTAAGCSRQQTVTVTVNPIPAVTNQTTTICSGNTFTITPSGGISGTTYSWAAPVSIPALAIGGGAPGTAQANISGAPTNVSSASGVASYTVTPSANGCAGASFMVDVTVNPVPVVSNATAAAICSGNAFSFTPPSVPGGTLYTWVIPVYSGSISGGTGQVGQSSISQVLSNAGTTAGSADYTITPSFNGCTGSSFVLTVPVNPVPVAGNQVTAICSGATFTVSPGGVPSGTTYTWGSPVTTPFGTITGSSAQAAPSANISQTLISSSTTAVQTVYSVIPVSGSCTGGAFSVTVTTNPGTSLSSTLTPSAICSSGIFSYAYASNTPGTSFAWQRAAIAGISNSAASGTNNPNESLVNVTGSPINVTYSYTLTTPASCTNVQNVVVTVNPTPVLSSSLTPAAVCSNSLFSYVPSANTGGATTFNWTRAAVTNISNGAAVGTNDPAETLINTSVNIIPVTYAYTLSAYGCSNSQNVIVNVNPLPVVSNQLQTICSGSSVLITPGGVPSGTQYSWPTPVSSPVSAVGGGAAASLQNSINQSLSNATLNPATLNYTVTPIANGCSGGTFSVTVTVNPLPSAADVTIAAVCSGSAFAYTPPSMPVGTQYSWTVPTISGTLNGGNAMFLQSSITQTLSSSNNVTNSADYTVTPVANGCTGGSFHVIVPVNPVPVVSDISLQACSGNAFSTTPATVPAGTSYTWAAPVVTPSGSLTGDAAQAAPISSITQLLTSGITTVATARYTVIPATAGCTGGAFTVTVQVNPGTSLSSTLTPAAICSNTVFNYAYSSNTPSTSFAWSRAVVSGISNLAASGTNDPNETLVNTTGSPLSVVYVYTLTTPAGCTRTQSVTVAVNPTPQLITTTSPAAVCSSTPFNYTPAANTGGGTVMNWTRPAVANISNGAGAGTGDPNETLINTSVNIIPVQYLYSLSYNGCSNAQTVTVNVNPVPVVANRNENVCSGSAFNVTPSGVPAGTQYTWTSPVSNPAAVVTGGSAASLQASISQVLRNGTISAATATYTVTPVANGCSGGNFTVAVNVKPIPTAIDATLAGICSGAAFSYTPASMPAGTTYTWGTPSYDPGAGLTGGTAQANQPSIGQLLNNANNIAGTATYEVTPVADGCTGPLFRVRVPVNPVPVVSNQSVTICSGTSFTISPTNVPAGTTYTWAMPVYTPVGAVSGGSAQPTPQLVISQYLSHPNTVAVQAVYTVTPAAGGCSGNTFNVTVGVNPGAQLNLATTAPAICSKAVFSYAASSNTPGTSFQWTRSAINGISNGAAAGTGNPLEPLYNITSQAITVTYNYTLTTPAGCMRTENVTVQVNPTPELTSSLNPAAVCSGSVFHYTPAATMPGTTFSWARNTVIDISNNPSAGTNDPAEPLVNTSLTGVNVPYQYTLAASGCTNTQTVTVRVNPTPAVANATVVTCSNNAFALSPANVPAGTVYTWGMPAASPLSAINGAAAQTTGQSDISQLLVNQTVNNATVRYTVTATAGVCSSAPFQVDVTVKPVATVPSQVLNAICSGTTFDFAPTNVPAGTTYTWPNPTLTPGNGLSGGTAESINQLSVKQTLSSINNLVNTAAYTVTPLTNGCAGNPFVLTVRVNPVPSVPDYRDTICTGESVSLIPSPVPVNTAYTWGTPANFPFGSLFGGTAQGSPTPTFAQTLINTTNNTALAVYTVRPVADNCVGNDFKVTVVVGSGLSTIPNQVAATCSGIAFDATPLNQPAGTTYTWSEPIITPAGTINGQSAAFTQQARVSQLLDNLTTANATAVYTVSAYNNGCTSNNFTATVTIKPIPRVSVSGNAESCRYPSDTLTLTFSGQAPWGLTYTDDASGTHTLTGITSSPYKLALPYTTANTRALAFFKVTHGGACSMTNDTINFSQIIHELPVGTLHSQRGIYICNNIPDTLFVTSPDSVGYQWRFNGINIPGANNDSLVTNMGGRYNVTLTNRFGCKDTATSQVSLIFIPQPVLRLTYDTYCINTLMNFTNITDTNLVGPTQWLWSFDNGRTSNTFHSSTTFTTGGDHHIQLKASQLYCPAVSTILDTTINIRFPIDGVTMPSMWAYKGVSNPISARNFPGYRYRWNPPYGINRPDSANTFFNLQNTQQYTIDLISPAGCITKDSLLVRVYEDKLVEIFVPKSFTPNGDGINDILYPYLTGIKEFKYFKVYNRFNQLMFETTNYDVGWNGMKGGSPQPMAIYIWVAVGTAMDGTPVEKRGQVLLLR